MKSPYSIQRFTLIELLLVTAISSLLALVLVASLSIGIRSLSAVKEMESRNEPALVLLRLSRDLENCDPTSLANLELHSATDISIPQSLDNGTLGSIRWVFADGTLVRHEFHYGSENPPTSSLQYKPLTTFTTVPDQYAEPGTSEYPEVQTSKPTMPTSVTCTIEAQGQILTQVVWLPRSRHPGRHEL